MASLCNVTKENFLSKNYVENLARKLVSGPYLIFKEFSVKRNLRRSVCRFGQMLIVLLIRTYRKWLAPKISFSNRGCAWFFANTKGLETSFQVAVFAEFFDKIFSFVIWHKLAKFQLSDCVYFPSYSVKYISCF